MPLEVNSDECNVGTCTILSVPERMVFPQFWVDKQTLADGDLAALAACVSELSDFSSLGAWNVN